MRGDVALPNGILLILILRSALEERCMAVP